MAICEGLVATREIRVLHSLGFFFQVTVTVLVFRKPLQLLKPTSEGAVGLDQAHNSPLLNRDDLVLGLKLLLEVLKVSLELNQSYLRLRVQSSKNLSSAVSKTL